MQYAQATLVASIRDICGTPSPSMQFHARVSRLGGAPQLVPSAADPCAFQFFKNVPLSSNHDSNSRLARDEFVRNGGDAIEALTSRRLGACASLLGNIIAWPSSLLAVTDDLRRLVVPADVFFAARFGLQARTAELHVVGAGVVQLLLLPHVPTAEYARSVWSRALLPKAAAPRSILLHSLVRRLCRQPTRPEPPCPYRGKIFLKRRICTRGCRLQCIYYHALAVGARVLCLLSFAPPTSGSPTTPTAREPTSPVFALKHKQHLPSLAAVDHLDIPRTLRRLLRYTQRPRNSAAYSFNRLSSANALASQSHVAIFLVLQQPASIWRRRLNVHVQFPVQTLG
ncbi:hypothetical protein PSPO01_11809 [Paraphaeosphaeria sporulosa]